MSALDKYKPHPGYNFKTGKKRRWKPTLNASDDALENMVAALKAYHELHDKLSDIIESGELKTSNPDDYRWLVESLAALGAMEANQ